MALSFWESAMMPKHLYLDYHLSSEIERFATAPGTAKSNFGPGEQK